MDNPNKYIPGVCNIGRDEIKRRRDVGRIGLILTALMWASFVWFKASVFWRLTIFFPAAFAAAGYLQAYFHFCAYFGLSALFNFGSLGRSQKVGQADFRAKDRVKAWRIIAYSVLIGLAVAAVSIIV